MFYWLSYWLFCRWDGVICVMLYYWCIFLVVFGYDFCLRDVLGCLDCSYFFFEKFWFWSLVCWKVEICFVFLLLIYFWLLSVLIWKCKLWIFVLGMSMFIVLIIFFFWNLSFCDMMEFLMVIWRMFWWILLIWVSFEIVELIVWF